MKDSVNAVDKDKKKVSISERVLYKNETKIDIIERYFKRLIKDYKRKEDFKIQSYYELKYTIIF